MWSQLLASVRVNFIYYRRNRLLLLIAVILAVTMLLTLLPALLVQTSNQRFGLVTTIFEWVNYYIFLFAAALGLLSVWSHVRDRSIKMIATKPLPLELWLLSHFLSAAAVVVVLVGMNLLLAGALTLYWNIPFQPGLLYISTTTICQCLVLFSYLAFLSVLLHPALGGLLALVLQEGLLHQLALLAETGRRMAGSTLYGAFLAAAESSARFVYSVLPVYQPFPDVVGRIQTSYRVEIGDLSPLLLTVAYTVTLATLLYFLSLASLSRRRLT